MNKILDSVLSARWIIVVALTLAFIYCQVMKIEISNTFMTVYGMAIAFYFNRKDRTENKTEGEQK